MMTTLEAGAKRQSEALEHLVSALQTDIYGLSFRVLCNREDAEDATQEILIQIVTHLSQFDFRSKLRTWAYRVAINYILDVKKSAVERMRLSFEQFAEEISKGLSSDAFPEAEQSLLIEEVKIGCTFGMLQCLDREHRLAYILGEIMELPGPEAAEVLGISADLFRKRLQLARTSILAFTKSHCGLVSDSAPCRCNRQVPTLLQAGRISEHGCKFAATAQSFVQTRDMVRQVEKARWDPGASIQPSASGFSGFRAPADASTGSTATSESKGMNRGGVERVTRADRACPNGMALSDWKSWAAGRRSCVPPSEFPT